MWTLLIVLFGLSRPSSLGVRVVVALVLYQKLNYSNLYILYLLCIQVGAHYFEEGNVQLDAKHECRDTTLIQVSDYSLSINFSLLCCRVLFLVLTHKGIAAVLCCRLCRFFCFLTSVKC